MSAVHLLKDSADWAFGVFKWESHSIQKNNKETICLAENLHEF